MNTSYLLRRDFCTWLEKPLGQRLLKIEQAELEGILPNLFGYHLIQLGAVSKEVDLLSSSCIWHQVVLEVDIWSEAQSPGLLSRVDALPFASATVDVIVLPHVLEYEPNPYQILREVQRVLVPEGTLIILGLNPWSFWGLWRFFLYRHKQMPWYGRFYSLACIRSWLTLLGLEAVKSSRFLFCPPLGQSIRLEQKPHFLEDIGRRWCPFFAGGYLIVAKKQVVRLSPVDARWCDNSSLEISSLAEPVA